MRRSAVITCGVALAVGVFGGCSGGPVAAPPPSVTVTPPSSPAPPVSSAAQSAPTTLGTDPAPPAYPAGPRGCASGACTFEVAAPVDVRLPPALGITRLAVQPVTAGEVELFLDLRGPGEVGCPTPGLPPLLPVVFSGGTRVSLRGTGCVATEGAVIGLGEPRNGRAVLRILPRGGG